DDFHKIIFQAREIDLRFGIAESRVEFEHLWPGPGEHYSGINNAVEVNSFSSATAQPRIEDAVPRLLCLGFAQKRGRAIRAHAARIQAAVAIQRPFMIKAEAEKAG